MILKDVIELIEEIAPHELAEPWDNSGLQVGNLKQEIKTIFISLDPTIDSLKQAINHKAELLLTHHPLIFKPILNLQPDTYPGNAIKMALEHNISIVCVHTNLDSAIGGINDLLAESLNLTNIDILKETPKVKGAGIGRIGDMNVNIDLDTLLEMIEKIFKVDKLRLVCPHSHRTIKRIAVVGGSGGSFVKSAFEKGADVLITGDIGYHDALNALSYGIILIDVGHFATESVAYKKFGSNFAFLLKTKGFDVNVIMSDGSDPFYIKDLR